MVVKAELALIDYLPNAIVTKTILKKITGDIILMSFDKGEEQPEKSSSFDTFLQVIDGTAEIIINAKKYRLQSGESIIIPAHAFNYIKANERFKVIQTIIKSV